ncbi:MAG: serine O-acetyltransferase [Methanobacterium sp.]|nr:serine O-acetyltransferase [Methanobacterium sp.]
MFDRIREEIQRVFARDPAARSTLEVILCSPGLHAIWLHRLANWFWTGRHILLGRFISTINRFLTGVEIHPGAQFGRRVLIDHCMGVVIGETAEIGEDVLIYQGVVLGGTSLKRSKRHPTIGNGVVIGSGAKIIGNIKIGDCCKIGAGSVVLKPAPPGSTIVGIPGRIVQESRKCAIDLDHGQLPDPVAEAIKLILKRQDELENELKNQKINTTIVKSNYFLTKKPEIEEIFTEGAGI